MMYIPNQLIGAPVNTQVTMECTTEASPKVTFLPSALNQKIADMKQEMEDQRSSFRSQLASKDDEIKRLLDELANQVRQNIAVCIVRLPIKLLVTLD